MATLILPVAVSGSGKSMLSTRWINSGFLPASAVVSPDALRQWLTDDVSDQTANAQVFQITRTIVHARLARDLVTYVDATHLTEGARTEMISVADRYQAAIVWLRFTLPFKLAIERNFGRERQVPKEVLTRQMDAFAALDWSSLPGSILNVDENYDLSPFR